MTFPARLALILVALLACLHPFCGALAQAPHASATPGGVQAAPGSVASPPGTPSPVASPSAAPSTATPSAAPAPSATPSPPPSNPPVPPKQKTGFSFDGDFRFLGEYWNYFDPAPNSEHEYAFGGLRLRLRGHYTLPRFAASLELQDVQLVGLPMHAIAPSPAGGLGWGASYEAYALRPSINTLGVRQGWLRFGKPGDFLLQAGRFEYITGLETTCKDPTLDWLKKNRLAQRLIGPGNYSDFARTFDGVRLDFDSPSSRVTGFVSHPTQGLFEPHFATQMNDVLLSNVAWTATQSKRLPNAEAQVFWMHFGDNRVAPMLDNRPAGKRGSIRGEGGIATDTYGLYYITRIGDADAVAWYAHQTGKWGALTQSADAFSVEAGFQPRGWDWKPWIRAGYSFYSGDGDPNDRRYNGFLAPATASRAWARIPYYTESNLRNVFGQLQLSPGKNTRVQMDFHFLSLDTPRDLWYQGSGPLQNRGVNGNSGRPSNGSSDLGQMLDVSVEHQIDPRQTVIFYFARAFGGSLVRSIYPVSRNGTYVNLDYKIRFP